MYKELGITSPSIPSKILGATTRRMECMPMAQEVMAPHLARGSSTTLSRHITMDLSIPIWLLMVLYTIIWLATVRAPSLLNHATQYICSSRVDHGDQTPNITDGWDRTFGPQYFHFNTGGSLEDLRSDADQYGLRPEWNAEFYDSIAKHVPNYVPTSGRGSFQANIGLPKGAENPIAILTENGRNYQDNVYDYKSKQYWGEVDKKGKVTIPRVVAGKYRLTVYADGIFGDFVRDDVTISSNKNTNLRVEWKAESAGTELFRIGTPDKSSGEYRHGYAASPDHPLLTEEYRLYWAAYDFVEEFPKGVTYKVGRDDPAKALNYVHWSVYGGKANYERPEPVYDNINNWTIVFDTNSKQLKDKKKATFTVS